MPGYTLFPSITPTDPGTPQERAEELADRGYTEVIAVVKSGGADKFLDELVEADDRKTVTDAIADRREVIDE